MECNNLRMVLSEHQSAFQLHNTREIMCGGKYHVCIWQRLLFHVVSNFIPFSPSGREILLVNHFHLPAFIQSHEKARCIIKVNCPSQLRSDRVLRRVSVCSLDFCTPKPIKSVTNILLAWNESKMMTDF